MRDKPAFLIVDMVKDNFEEKKKLPITPFARRLIEPINALIQVFRAHSWPVVFPTDAFHADDFIFQGKMNPHSLEGTKGAEIIDELNFKPEDFWMPKPVFSAFFKTNLDQWLRSREVTLCAVAGISTHFCVLTTIFDALSHGFKAVLLEDCTAAFNETIHRQILDVYRRNPLHPLLKVTTSGRLADELTAG